MNSEYINSLHNFDKKTFFELRMLLRPSWLVIVPMVLVCVMTCFLVKIGLTEAYPLLLQKWRQEILRT